MTKANKVILYILLVPFLIIVGIIFLKGIDKVFTISRNPAFSIMFRLVILILFSATFILKKKKILLYCLILGFPFMSFALNRVSLVVIFSSLLTLVYFKEIRIWIKTRKNIFKIPFLIIVFSLIFSTVMARYPQDAIAQVIFFISLGGLFHALSAFIKDEQDMKLIFKMLLFVLSFSVIFSFLQLIFGHDKIVLNLGGFNPNVSGFGVNTRFPSIFTDAQVAGQYFAVMSIMSMAAFPLFPRCTFWISLLIFGSVCALFLTGSRIAIMSFVVASVSLQLLKYSVKSMVIFIGVCLFIILLGQQTYEYLLPSVVQERFETHDIGRSMDFRLQIWKQSMPIFFHNPGGVGLGGENLFLAGTKENVDFMKYFYYLVDGERRTHFESSFLHILYALGLVGFIGYILMIVQVFVAGKFLTFQVGKTFFKDVGLPVNFAFIVWVICSTTSPVITKPQPMLIYIILLVFINKIYQMSKNVKS